MRWRPGQTWAASRQEADAKVSGDREGKTARSLPPGLRSTLPGHQGPRPHPTVVVLVWSPCTDSSSVLSPVLEEMPHSGQAAAFGPAVLDGDAVLL